MSSSSSQSHESSFKKNEAVKEHEYEGFQTPRIPTKQSDRWLLSPPQLEQPGLRKSFSSPPDFVTSSDDTSMSITTGIDDKGMTMQHSLQSKFHVSPGEKQEDGVSSFQTSSLLTENHDLMFPDVRKLFSDPNHSKHFASPRHQEEEEEERQGERFRRRASSFDISQPIPRITLRPRFSKYDHHRIPRDMMVDSSSPSPSPRIPHVPPSQASLSPAVNSMYHQPDSATCSCLDCSLARLSPPRHKNNTIPPSTTSPSRPIRLPFPSNSSNHNRSYTHDGACGNADVFAAAISEERRQHEISENHHENHQDHIDDEDDDIDDGPTMMIPAFLQPKSMMWSPPSSTPTSGTTTPDIVRPIARHTTGPSSSTTSTDINTVTSMMTGSLNLQQQLPGPRNPHNIRNKCSSPSQQEVATIGDTICSTSTSAFDAATPKSDRSVYDCWSTDSETEESIDSHLLMKDTSQRTSLLPRCADSTPSDEELDFPFNEMEEEPTITRLEPHLPMDEVRVTEDIMSTPFEEEDDDMRWLHNNRTP